MSNNLRAFTNPKLSDVQLVDGLNFTTGRISERVQFLIFIVGVRKPIASRVDEQINSIKFKQFNSHTLQR
jgi:hypothetical protein